MERWRQLRSTMGAFRAWQTTLGMVFFGFCSVSACYAEASLVPAVLYALALAAPWFVRDLLVAHFDASRRVIAVLGGGLIVTALVAGQLRGRLWEEGAPLEWPGFLVLIMIAGFYLSSFFWLYSDPRLVQS